MYLHNKIISIPINQSLSGVSSKGINYAKAAMGALIAESLIFLERWQNSQSFSQSTLPDSIDDWPKLIAPLTALAVGGIIGWNTERITPDQEYNAIQRLLDSIHGPMFYRSLEGKYEGCNDLFSKHMGVKKQAILGHHFSELADPKIVAILNQKDAELKTSKDIQIFDIQKQKADGSTQHLIFQRQLHLDIEGNSLGIIGLVTDISELVNTKRLLAKSTSIQETILQSATDAVLMVDDKGIIEFANPATTTIFGYAPDELAEQDLHSLFVPEEGKQGIAEGLRNFATTGKGAVIGTMTEIIGIRKSGKRFPLELSISSVKFNKNWHAIGMVRDISKRKEIEEELRKKQELIVSEQLRSDFSAHLSHEFRTPLNGIIGISKILSKMPLPKNLTPLVTALESSGQRLLQLSTNIIETTRLSDQNIKLEEDDFNIKELIMNTIHSFLNQTQDPPVDIELNFESPQEIFNSDANAIELLLFNLIDNAIKFDATTIAIKVLVLPLDSTEDLITIKVEVIDNGIGISKEDHNRVFQFATQVDPSLNRKYDGIGLGLPVVSQVVGKMGGQLTVESELGSGSKFTVQLPLKPGNETDIKQQGQL
jgi:PAS domain S-box-containing protein